LPNGENANATLKPDEPPQEREKEIEMSNPKTLPPLGPNERPNLTPA
jgi:hypothetical protein